MAAGMTLSLPVGLSPLVSGSPPLGKAEKAARDFETILLTQLMDSLEKTFSGVPEDQTPGASDYRLMATQALASEVAKKGGIGIARLILRHLPPTRVQGKECTGE